MLHLRPLNKKQDINPSSDVASLLQYDKSDNNTIICQCNKTFNSIVEWEFHNFHYHINLKYMCTHCNFRYLDINDFLKHMKSAHSINYYYCSICRNLYYHNEVFENHLFYHHVSYANPAMYICHKCTPWREIYFYNELVTHDEREHRENPIINKTICYVCGKKCPHYRFLLQHKGNHYKKRLRRCLVCWERELATLIDLKEHIRENHPERFLCTRCFSGVTFESEANLQRHVEEYHRDQLELL